MAIDMNKINPTTNTQLRSSSSLLNGEPGTQASSQSAALQKNDSVMITPQAQQLQDAQTKIASLPEVDPKKVEEIKQAIAEGRYKVDAEKLAANIASFEAELSELNID